MKIIVRFITKGASPSVRDAIKIAEHCEHYIEGSEYYVHFDTPNENLKKLLDIACSWKTTQVFVDDKEVNAKKLRNVLFCPSKLLCKGICDHIRIGWRKLDELLRKNQEDEKLIGIGNHGIVIEENTAFVDERTINDFAPFLEQIDEKKFRLEKDKLKEWINNEFDLELKYCEKINIEKILEIIDNLPEIFEEANISKVKATLRCPDKFFCKGICTHLKFGGLPLQEYLKNNVNNDVGIIEKHELQELINFLKPCKDEKKVELDKKKFKEFIEKKLSFEFEHCNVIDKNKTLSLIDKLPTKFEIIEYSLSHEMRDDNIDMANIPDEELIEEFEYLSEDKIRKFAKIFADVFEERLRKVLKEVMKNES